MTENIAVVGNGYWGKNLVRNFSELGALRLVCDEDPSVEAAVRSQYPSVAYVREFSQVLSDAAVRGVVLATPAATHYAMAKRALLAGKDVFVEKPLALNAREGSELVELAEREHRVLMVGHILRYHPAVRKLKQFIRDGSLGRLQYIYSNRLNIGKIRTEENILWSFAPHDVSVILNLLDESPVQVSCEGGSYLSHHVSDVTLSQFSFASGVRAHVFVSWLHPVKEQRLVVVGSENMAVFDDTAPEKLVLYPHRVEWKDRVPSAVKGEAQAVPLDHSEPLRNECREFLDCMISRDTPLTDGREGVRVLRVLNACQESLEAGSSVSLDPDNTKREVLRPYFAHETAIIGETAVIGARTRIWHFTHVMNGATVGEGCIFGQNCHIASGAFIGDNVKVQNNVSIYAGTVVEDDVFLGPSCVLTNVTNPRSQINRHALYEKTIIHRGATVGANATIVCGVELGRYCFIGAGTVIAKNVPDYALMVGSPGRQVGWMSRHGHRLMDEEGTGVMVCPESGYRYRQTREGVLRCLDLDEDSPLPKELTVGNKTYDEMKYRLATVV